MITIENIHKRFGSLEVLKGISLHVKRGELVSIVGASGAGKTTLLQIMATLSRPDEGSLSIDGVALEKLNDEALSRFRNQKVGIVFQFHHLLPEFSALENVTIPALIAGRSRQEAEAEARRLLQMLGLGDRADHKPSQLSGGEQQRVSIARALIN
ncbi:MAG: ATP-binding cassette domain-containing protein, partial [Alistipes sp.]|nr:ATP-binding cassette domain-containing protein [Alistipes sp.]